MASTIHPAIKQVPPMGTMAPKILTPESVKAYKQPLKIVVPMMKRLADQTRQRLMARLASSPITSRARAWYI